jgi:predicted phage tail protein
MQESYLTDKQKARPAAMRRVTIAHRVVAFSVGALSTAAILWGSFVMTSGVGDHSGVLGLALGGFLLMIRNASVAAVIGGVVLLLIPRTRGYGHLVLWLGLGSGLVILALFQFGEALL